MANKTRTFNRPRLWGLFSGLALLAALFFTPATVETAYAQSTPAGFVGAWGDNRKGQSTVPSGLSDVIAVAGGGAHSLALRSNGAVVAWGDNSFGQSTVPAGLSSVIALAAGNNHSLALRSNGAVVAWGDNSFSQSTVPAGLNGVVAIAAGGDHSLARKSDGTIVAWGDDTFGQRTVPAGLNGVVAIAAGAGHSLARKSNGTVVAWGENFSGQGIVPSGVIDVVAIEAGSFHNLIIAPQPSVTINQAVGQPDPTNRNPLVFTAIFSRPVTGFTPADVTLGGTANRSGAMITITGGAECIYRAGQRDHQWRYRYGCH